jgi:alpha-L-arabinofuranosidase
VVSAPETSYSRNGRQASFRGLNGSASVSGSRLTVTVTNPSLEQAREVEIVVRGGAVQSAAGMMLAERDAHAHNSWEAPGEVESRSVAVTVFSCPAASVTRITFGLG